MTDKLQYLLTIYKDYHKNFITLSNEQHFDNFLYALEMDNQELLKLVILNSYSWCNDMFKADMIVGLIRFEININSKVLLKIISKNSIETIFNMLSSNDIIDYKTNLYKLYSNCKLVYKTDQLQQVISFHSLQNRFNNNEIKKSIAISALYNASKLNQLDNVKELHEFIRSVFDYIHSNTVIMLVKSDLPYFLIEHKYNDVFEFLIKKHYEYISEQYKNEYITKEKSKLIIHAINFNNLEAINVILKNFPTNVLLLINYNDIDKSKFNDFLVNLDYTHELHKDIRNYYSILYNSIKKNEIDPLENKINILSTTISNDKTKIDNYDNLLNKYNFLVEENKIINAENKRLSELKQHLEEIKNNFEEINKKL